MLATACAKLGIEPRHTRPYKPQGRGKVERLFLTIERQWGREAQALMDAGRITTLDEVQRFFAAWLNEYNARVHSSTKDTPNTRLGLVHPDHPIAWVAPDVLADAFLWSQTRTVTAVGTISLEGHDFEVAPELAHRKITLWFDPYDLSRILVEHDGHSYGVATPLGKLPAHSRHVRPPQEPAKPETDRTRFDQLLTSHDEAAAFEQAGYMHFHPEGDDGQ